MWTLTSRHPLTDELQPISACMCRHTSLDTHVSCPGTSVCIQSKCSSLFFSFFFFFFLSFSQNITNSASSKKIDLPHPLSDRRTSANQCLHLQTHLLRQACQLSKYQCMYLKQMPLLFFPVPNRPSRLRGCKAT